MGPCVGMGDPFCGDCDEMDTRGLNAVMLCETPSAKMNCSRNSMLVRPLAVLCPHLSQLKAARKINPQQNNKNIRKKYVTSWQVAVILMDS